jgi:hypothetical protein
MAHSIALVAAVSGLIGQTAASSGTLGVVGLCCVVFVFAVVYIAVLWPKDMSSSRFMLSGFMSNLKQTVETAKTNRTMQLILGISTLFESTVIIFTFYWAPWMAGMVTMGEDGVGELPYEIIYSSFVVCTMIGNYLFTLYAGDMGSEQVFKICLMGTAGLFTFGSVIFSPSLAFWIAMAIQMCLGVYWPSIGTLKGTIHRARVPCCHHQHLQSGHCGDCLHGAAHDSRLALSHYGLMWSSGGWGWLRQFSSDEQEC